jgi:TnpA family transposase
MALAKLVGFDLCPWLAGLKDRKLYLPRGVVIPARLQPIARETVSRRAIAKEWEPLLRIAASVKTGVGLGDLRRRSLWLDQPRRCRLRRR